jgi:hypothetical protein
MRFIIALTCALLFTAGQATAVDYDKIERRLSKEPAYQAKKQWYALLLFGAEARLKVWVVLDGETLYVDRNGDGDLTGAGERFAKEADCKNIEIADPDGKTRYVITRVRSDYSHYTPKARREREAKGIPPGLLIEVSIQGSVEYHQYCDVEEMRDDPRKATISHFHGPLSIGQRLINWKIWEGDALKTGDSPSRVCAFVGTMSEKHGCWVVVGSYDERDISPLPKGLHPVVEIDFPGADPKAPPVRRKYELKEFC